jgi:hypothetical protein
LRRKIESGEFVPEEIWAKEENKAAGTDDKAANDKQISIRQEKVQSFKINLKLYSLILVFFQFKTILSRFLIGSYRLFALA